MGTFGREIRGSVSPRDGTGSQFVSGSTSTQQLHSVVVHAHCYQPPREDPWFELVDAEPSATPDHDWNARIDRECYARLGAAEVRSPDPRAAARDPDARGGLARIVNLYGWCSFDVGPTLCEWMDRSSTSFAAMREGDEASIRRWGHGNAIAAPFHHIILPLASRRDKITEIRWGIADFRRRFGREPEGLWLPECAVDEETLEVLALEGIRFTILAPYQVRTESDHGGMPVRWRAGGNREVIIVPYDGSLAGDVAFGGLLRNAAALADRFEVRATMQGATCTTLATDGETFGHHHRDGSTVLAEALALLTSRQRVRITNAASLVATHEATLDAEVVSPSSWSCAHGVERWRSDCGCRLDTSARTSQRWRTPLRQSLQALAARCDEQFEREGASIFKGDPWDVRNEYGGVVSFEGFALSEFVSRHVEDGGDVMRARELLEMQRAGMRTFTSCAWFFDDVARIETRQVLRYAARALELSGAAARLTPDLIAGLEHAVSNAPGGGTGGDLFVREALPHRDNLMRAAAACIALRARNADRSTFNLGSYVATAHDDGTLDVTHSRTGRGARFAGTVSGTGPQTRVLVRYCDRSGAEQSFDISELPESAARLVLDESRNDDIALDTAS